MRAPRVLRLGVQAARQLQHSTRRALLRLRGVRVASTVRIHGAVHAQMAKKSSICLGDNVVLNAKSNRNTLEARGPTLLKTIRPSAKISIGRDSGLTSVTISSGSSVDIGNRVLVGAGVLITDCDHHPVATTAELPRRFAGLPPASSDRPVIICDDAFIGARTIILKGVTIGEGAVIGAGSVVTGNIPPYSVAAGNPCVVKRGAGQA